MVTIGILLSPGFQMLCLSTSTIFEFANLLSGQSFYRVDLISEQGGLVPSSMGFSVETQAFKQRSYDTVLVLGDNQLIEPTPALIPFLQDTLSTSRRLASACTGSFLLAAAGLLDGRKATTHWFHARTFREAFPKVKLEEDRIFTVDGKLWTSAGMTACIDLALALVEQDLGAEVARDVARKLVVYHRRAGGQSQFSALLELEPKSDRVQTALTYAKEHLREELSVEQLA
ncbi:GlxA family transcriptional regulator [Pseudomonas helleri]|uniref:GlxA family transcriptional regulator n=2 Tax=Pseudomonas TaxID=286 RepID=UPI003F991C0F